MVGINWGKAMTAAQQGRLKDFFDRISRSEAPENRKRIAELTNSFADFVESLFRQFVEAHPYLLGGHEGLATFDAIYRLKTAHSIGEEFWGEIQDAHQYALAMISKGAKLEDDPEENRMLNRFYELAYKFRMEELRQSLEGENK